MNIYIMYYVQSRFYVFNTHTHWHKDIGTEQNQKIKIS